MTLVLMSMLALAAAAGPLEEARGIVGELAGPDTRGRAAATDLAAAADRLADRLGAYGEVERQPVQFDGASGENLILRLPGRLEGAGWIVLGAHYDHLGVGAAGEPHAGEVFFGADDNASGCAVLLLAAGRLAEGDRDRGVAVVLFTGEEQGLAGSRAFVGAGPGEGGPIHAMINLDTVGRLSAGELTIFGTGSARVFEPTLQGLNGAFGLPLQLAAQNSGASDDRAFVEARIPALHLFTGAWPEYHRPSDRPGTLDYEGLVTLAGFTAELVDYLASADVPLDFVAGGQKALADPDRTTEGKRKVSFGSIPDFNYQGDGVRISGVLPGSPAAEAGLQEGDVITGFAGADTPDLTAYSEAMKLHAPGDVVEVRFLRDGEALSVEVTLVERR